MLGSLNGLAQGAASLCQTFAPFAAGFLWSEFADSESPRGWPLGPYLSWNLFGVVGIVAFLGSCAIHKPNELR